MLSAQAGRWLKPILELNVTAACWKTDWRSSSFPDIWSMHRCTDCTNFGWSGNVRSVNEEKPGETLQTVHKVKTVSLASHDKRFFFKVESFKTFSSGSSRNHALDWEPLFLEMRDEQFSHTKLDWFHWGKVKRDVEGFYLFLHSLAHILCMFLSLQLSLLQVDTDDIKYEQDNVISQQRSTYGRWICHITQI